MKRAILLIFTLAFLGCSNSNSLVQIKGKISIHGSMPHTFLAIRDSKNHKYYKINNSKDFSLQNMQNRVIEIKAKILKKRVGPGFPAIIEIVEVKK